MPAIETFTDFQKTTTRNSIRIKYQNVEYSAFLVKVDIINDDDVAITVNEHVELWFNNAWLFLQLIDVEIVSNSTTSTGDTIYEGDVTVVENSNIQFATTQNGDSIYGVFTINADGTYSVLWFNMDGSPYTGDTTTITITATGFKTSVKVFERLILVNAEQNIYFAFLEVLTFDENGVLLMTNFTTYGGVSIAVNATLIVEAPESIVNIETYQSDDYFDFSNHSSGVNVVGITLNITNSIQRINGVVLRSSAILYLHNTEERVVQRRKRWAAHAEPGRRCGTKPRVRCENGASVVCDIATEVKPILTRDKAAYDGMTTLSQL